MTALKKQGVQTYLPELFFAGTTSMTKISVVPIKTVPYWIIDIIKNLI